MPNGRRTNDKRLYSDDHDLLTRIDERLQGLATTCNGLVTTLGRKADLEDITTLRVEMATKHGDFETRMRALEQFNWKQAGVQAGMSGVLMTAIALGLRFWK
jgi:hypothetical protein